ncbi:MAG: SCP2 sterol-binding domain-containing protein [Solirubrobacteraceae bacterium]|nr:SCP2 sterol-binding domain-containing protein [Solirubrobacteraceae bacterium]
MPSAASAFQRFVRRSPDARLERIFGSRAVQRLLARRLAARYRPEAADGFAGELQVDLRRPDGCVDAWALRVGHEHAHVSEGPAGAPALTLTTTVADALRMAAGEIPVDRAILEGRLDLAGDWGLATRLGQMFGGGGGA